ESTAELCNDPEAGKAVGLCRWPGASTHPFPFLGLICPLGFVSGLTCRRRQLAPPASQLIYLAAMLGHLVGPVGREFRLFIVGILRGPGDETTGPLELSVDFFQ